MENEYYYNETVTRFYDAVYENFPYLKAGADFYRDEISQTRGRVLEAGVGTGRIFLPALAAGADMYGLDYSERMLARLKEKLPANEHHRVWNADMRRFDSGMSYSLVISPFRVFQHMLTVDDQLNALNSIYNVLEDGGRLIFDVFNPDMKRLITPINDFLEFEGEYEPGKKLQRYSTVSYDNSIQQMELKFRFVWDEDGEEKTGTFTTPLRYYFRYELENLVGRTKFKLEKVYGSFTRDEFGSGSKEQILILKK